MHDETVKLTIRICNTYYFSTARTVTRTRLYATFICTLPVLLMLEHVEYTQTAHYV